jgi:hypothetical protein
MEEDDEDDDGHGSCFVKIIGMVGGMLVEKKP